VEEEEQYLENHADVGAVFCKDIFVDGDNNEYGRLELQPEVSGGSPLSYSAVFNALLEYKNRMFVCPTVMARADVYHEVGLYRQDKFFNTADLDMWLRIAQKHPVVILEKYLIRYRHFAGQSSRRYHKLRTNVERFFTIMDLYLEDGGREIATSSSLAAYEGHRVEDLLMIAVNHYILDQLQDAKTTLAKVRLRNLLKGHQIQRGRMLLLFVLLNALVQLPRLRFFSNLFYRRWHAGK
jgi:hypothetical protein